MSKLKSKEQSTAISDINQKKVQGQFDEFQRIIRRIKDENDELKGKMFNLEDEKSQFENILREKERKLKDMIEENEDLIKRKKKNG